ncbi:exopolysaccharide biosynthesis protein [Mesorhizobium sp. B4-1-3]|uniref:GumC family protein n=1 Tax=Mesorhizobium sp. B4-1-3 TaxID=2589889 RepID=UPI00112699E1|nr:exopolysaccharide transport family protein [Mesorhizobium sp. B4-1-3]TPI09031.1 exopolysaccharide biosynthesis protein [Mesorhizobium sp. B4-1-3]
MEGSKVSRIQRARTAEIPAATREHNPLMRRPLRDPAEAQTPFSQLWVTVARRKWFLLAMALLGGVIAAILGFSRPAQFEATTQLIVDATARNATAGATDMLDTSMDNNLTLLTSLGHMRRVAAALGKVGTEVQNTADKAAGQGTPSTPSVKNQSFAAGLLDRIWRQADESGLSPGAADAAQLKLLRRGIRVGQELRSRVITVGFTDPDPVRAALVANTFAQLYVADLTANTQAADKAELASVVAALPKVQSDLAQATDRLEEYRLTHGAVDQGAMDSAARETADLNQQLSLSKAGLSAVESRLQHIQDLRASGAPGASLAEAIGSPTLADLVARQKKDPDDQGVGAAIKLEIQQGIDRISSEANVYRTQVAALEERKNVLDAVVADTAGRVSGMRALEPTVAILTQRYNELLTRQQDLTRRIANPSPGVSIISTAWPPTIPKSLSPLYLIPPGMVVFGLIGGILALVGKRLDRTLRGEAEAEAALGFPCMGVLPKVSRLHAKRLQALILRQKNSTYGHAALSLLINAAPQSASGRSSQIALVTSSGKNDGKTELAWSLALSATRLGGNVLFVDLDPADGQLTNEFVSEFSVSKPHGSFEGYVKSRSELADSVVNMPDLGVDFMAAPIATDDLLKLLSEVDEPRHFTDQLAAKYNFVVLNGPPGLEGPESRLLTSWADCVLFAVRWGSTPRSVARSILESLQPDGPGSIPVGTVLTRVNLKQHAQHRFGDSGDLLLARNQ